MFEILYFIEVSSKDAISGDAIFSKDSAILSKVLSDVPLRFPFRNSDFSQTFPKITVRNLQRFLNV